MFSPFYAFGRKLDLSVQNYFPYNIDWDAAGKEGFHIGDMVGHKPAGKYGGVTVKDGHFYVPDHGFIRFWGTNMVYDDNFPSRENARKIAARMAKLGFNLVRFHHMDGFFPAAALCDKYYLKRGKLNPDVMDRLCFFVNELKQNGIYYNLNFMTSLRLDNIKALPEHEQLKRHKYLTFYSPEVKVVQEKLIRDVLLWTNKYTGIPLGQDSALAMVESNNEDSLISLLSEGIRNNKYIPEYYYNQIKKKFNSYLEDKYGNDKAIRKMWGARTTASRAKFGAYELPSRKELNNRATSQAYIDDVVGFLIKLEHDHYIGIKKLLIEELNCTSPLGGVNNWYTHAGTKGTIGAADYIDMHGYFNKRIPLRKWQALELKLKHRLSSYYMVLDINHLAHIGEIARHPDVRKPYPQLRNDFFKFPKNYVEGIPCSLSEWNHSGPTRYGYQMPLLIGAYSSLQDWDSLAQFHYYGHVEQWTRGNYLSKGYDIQKDRLFHRNSSGFDPSLMTQTPAASLAFRRGDISVATKTILLDLSGEQNWLETIKNDRYDTRMALKHRIRKFYSKGQYEGEIVPNVKIGGNPKSVRSDTGEIVWETAPEQNQGRVLVNSPRTQAASGNLEMGVIEQKNVVINATTAGAVWITSLSSNPISSSEKLLVTIIGDSENTNVRYKVLPFKLTQSKSAYYIEDFGRSPVLLSKVRGTITIKALDEFTGINVRPLGRDCKPLAAIEVKLVEGGFSMNLDAAKTALYRVEIYR